MDVRKRKATHLSPSADTILHGVRQFIERCSPEQRELMCQILDESRRPYSLRVIEHFFLKYLDSMCKYDPEIMDSYDKYRRMTKSFPKKLLDCFAREDDEVQVSIEIEINGKTYTSTPGQLNFLRLFVESNFLPIIDRHIDQISEQMTQERLRQRKRAAATLLAIREEEIIASH